jgi:lia operon protein LiaH
MPKYIAKQSIGHFRPGDEIKGLEAKQLQALLASGAIEEEQAIEQPKENSYASQMATLAAENAELKANELSLTEAKNKAEAENAELKAKFAEFEKSQPVDNKPVAKPKESAK